MLLNGCLALGMVSGALEGSNSRAPQPGGQLYPIYRAPQKHVLLDMIALVSRITTLVDECPPARTSDVLHLRFIDSRRQITSEVCLMVYQASHQTG